MVSELVSSKALFRGRLTLVMWEGDPFGMRNMRYSHARTLSPPLFHDTIRVAELGSLSAKMAMEIFVKRAFTIFATNALFLRNLQI